MNAILGARLRATFAPEMANEAPQDCNSDCENCGRKPSEYGGVAYVSTDSYKRQLAHCPDCRPISIQAPQTLGIAIEPATGFTLATFKGGYLVVPATDKPSLLVSGKYPAKIHQHAVDVVPLGGHAAKAWLFSNHQADSYVLELSPRRERFSRHAMPCDHNHLVIATTSGAAKISLSDWQNSRDALRGIAKYKDVISLARGLTEGRLHLSSDKVQAALTPEIMAVLSALPKDPISRCFVLDALSGLEAV
jgi:hypothetical protein